MFGLSTLSATILIGGLVAGLYMAWNIGANDLANSMGPAVGSKALNHKEAVVIASVLTVTGALLAGEHVASTVQIGIFDVTQVENTYKLSLGALSAVAAAGLWITLATWKSIPISTSHSIVGGMLGFGLLYGGIGIIYWDTLGYIIISWVTSPIFGGIGAFLVFKLIVKVIFNSKKPFTTAKKSVPFILGITIFIITLSILYDTALSLRIFGKRLSLLESLIYSLAPALVLGFLGKYPVLKGIENEDGIDDVEKVFKRLMLLTACYIAFSFGANNVGNAVGPIVLIIENTFGNSGVPSLFRNEILLSIGGIGLAIGISTWGYKVIKTIGFKLTSLTNTRGFAVTFGGATTMLVASMVGMPISTSHTVVGAVLGVGIARGVEAIDLSVIKRIIYSWLMTVPIAATTSVVLYLIMVQFI